MVNYKCFECGKEVASNYTKKKIRCPYCGCKVLLKTRSIQTTVKAI